MNLEPAPRLNKLVFLAIDAGLVAIAIIIVLNAKNPYAPLPFVTAVACVLIAAIIGLGPLVIEFIAENRDYVQEERRRVTDQVQRLHAAGESLVRAAAQIKAVEEAVHKTAHAAENLPYRMQEKLAEFNEALATKDTDEREALERELDELRAANASNLKAVAEKIAKAATEWSALEAASRKQLSAAQDATAALNDKLQATLAQLDSRIAALGSVSRSPVGGVPSPREETAAPAAASEETKPEPSSVIESVTLSESAATSTEEIKPKKPRAPRKSKPEDTLAAMSADLSAEGPAKAEPAPAESDASSVGESSSASNEESAAPAEASISSDGATRLLVTAYIGIGNKLFIRGDGPGLSWDKGVPMQFVSIGKWGWASNDVTMPVACKLYKNDETAALSGEIFLEPGKHVD